MAQAMENVSDCAILVRNPLLTFAQDSYSYRIERRGDQSFYTVASGKEYFYVTTAVSAVGEESAFSNEASATIPNP